MVEEQRRIGKFGTFSHSSYTGRVIGKLHNDGVQWQESCEPHRPCCDCCQLK